ncbi:nuclear transport factor 2 family protein [Enterobacteriaceae bacterium H11S18]|uniref:nuclear transport factor 2 family protein n=1 Tax=Dryocola clanedunensis TaxID=2925396 RepID=UPI0022EFE832|nr:nuclear transport factor 2 family protein [Dryocola clanedunensis]MCT4704380.1 nuclear transport factor 2 family protein [Dryocola clanedunensis]MCT4710347.1 nuclear transport factor 2 family protein [Dryocola clanedunensis]
MTDNVQYLADRLAIGDLLNGWIYRDQSQWDELAKLFHPDGTIEVTWFEGLASEFIKGSMRMGESDIGTKHLIGVPTVTFNAAQNKALAITNAMIIGQNSKLALGATCHNRFFDMIEKRNGEWKILRRQVVYDFGSFDFPLGFVEIDREAAASYPLAYAPLAYMLEKSGFPVQRVFATKGSELEKTLQKETAAWLAA